MKLNEKGLLVTLNISVWTGRKLDKKITNEVNTQHNAKEDAGRYNKLLFDKKFVEPITKVVSAARSYHYAKTLAWGDNGERLLPSVAYLDYTNEMAALQGQFNAAVNDFFSNYDTVIADAKVRLNGMFNPLDYPTKGEMLDKFAFNVGFMPVPTSDFRVMLVEKDAADLKERIEQELGGRYRDAVKQVWARIKEQLVAMKEKLSDEKGIFRDSLFGNLADLIEVLPSLNITGDADIAAACDDLKQLVVSPDAVRQSVTLRADKAKQVNDILSKFGL